jgi:hypothetical protein
MPETLLRNLVMNAAQGKMRPVRGAYGTAYATGSRPYPVLEKLFSLGDMRAPKVVEDHSRQRTRPELGRSWSSLIRTPLAACFG